MKKEIISPLLTMSAMILLLISRLLDARKLDWIAYLAIILIIACVIIIAQILNKPK